MKKSIMKLEGVTVLNKAQKKEINGGRVNCDGVTASTVYSDVQLCCCLGIDCKPYLRKDICMSA